MGANIFRANKIFGVSPQKHKILVLLSTMAILFLASALTVQGWANITDYVLVDTTKINSSGIYFAESKLTTNGVCVVSTVAAEGVPDLQSCVDAVNPGETIYVRAGEYDVNTARYDSGKNWGFILNKSNISVVCEPGAVFVKNSALNLSAMIGSPSTTHKGITIDGCSFECNYLNSTYASAATGAYKGAGLNQYGDGWKLLNSKFNQCGPYGAVVWHGGDGYIRGNTMTNSKHWIPTRQKYGSCIMMTYLTATNNIISDNICLNPAGNGLFFEDNADNNQVTNFQVFGAYRGLSCENSDDIQISNIQIKNPSELGMHITSCSDIIVDNFIIENTTSNGIWTLDTLSPGEGKHQTFSNGHIKNAGAKGLYCSGLNNVSVYNVNIRNSATTDFEMSNCDDYIDENNYYDTTTITSSTRQNIPSSYVETAYSESTAIGGIFTPNRTLSIKGGHPNSRIEIIRTDNSVFAGGIEMVGNDYFPDWSIGSALCGTTGFEICEDKSDLRFLVEEGGNVGIGTSNPQTELDVEGSINVSGDVCIDNGGGCLSTTAGDNTTWNEDLADTLYYSVSGGTVSGSVNVNNNLVLVQNQNSKILADDLEGNQMNLLWVDASNRTSLRSPLGGFMFQDRTSTAMTYTSTNGLVVNNDINTSGDVCINNGGNCLSTVAGATNTSWNEDRADTKYYLSTGGTVSGTITAQNDILLNQNQNSVLLGKDTENTQLNVLWVDISNRTAFRSPEGGFTWQQGPSTKMTLNENTGLTVQENISTDSFCLGGDCITSWSSTGDNTSWNQDLADTLYATIGAGSDNTTWNQDLANTLYASIGIIEDNTTWNEDRANTLYSADTDTYNTSAHMITATSSSYVSLSDWTTQNNYPAACGAGDYVSAIGDTLTCSTPTDTDTDTYNTTADLTNVGFRLAINTDALILGNSTTGGDGKPKDQSTNTTSSVTFESVNIGSWNITAESTKLFISYNDVKIGMFDSEGNLIIKGVVRTNNETI